MRTVKKRWLSNNMAHTERIKYNVALDELEIIFNKYTREEIKAKLVKLPRKLERQRHQAR